MTPQVPNYTNEMVAVLRKAYDPSADQDVRQAQILAVGEQLGKSPASIRAKLTREGLYVPLAKAPNGKNVVRKAEMVRAIADALEVDVDVIGSLEKATKVALGKVLAAIK